MKRKGFTLIELVVVMAIIAVLAVLIIGAIIVARRTSTETIHRGNAKTVQTAVEAYYTKRKIYPAVASATSFNSLVTGAGFVAVIPDTILTSTVTSNDCAVGGATEGGGRIRPYNAATDTNAPSGTTITIEPYDFDCTDPLGIDNNIYLQN